MVREAPPDSSEAVLSKRVLLERAQNIISGALQLAPDSFSVAGIRKIKKGYRVKFHDLRPQVAGEDSEKSLVLDLAFPIETRPISEVIEEERGLHRELFLCIGSGAADYPKKEDADPKEAKRAFFAHDISYGVMPHEENYRSLGLPQRYAMPARILRSPAPAATHFFNELDYRAIPNDTFETIQMVNVLTDPKVSTTPLKEALRMLKPDTGELVVMNERGPEGFSIHHCEFMSKAYGGIIKEVLFHQLEAEFLDKDDKITNRTISDETIERLKSEYHISPMHFEEPLAEGSYCIVLEKPTDKSEKGIEYVPNEE